MLQCLLHSFIEVTQDYNIFACNPLKTSKTFEKQQTTREKQQHKTKLKQTETKRQFSESLGGGTLLSQESGRYFLGVVFMFLLVFSSFFWVWGFSEFSSRVHLNAVKGPGL